MTRWLTPAILLLALSACRPSEPGGAEVASVSRERAQALFLAHCAICHGERGDGNGPRRGSLFQKPPDFRKPAWRAGKSLPELRAAIRDGSPGSDMPAWRSLGDEEIAGLAEYVLELGAPR